MKSIYLVGSLRNKLIPGIARSLREIGLEVFDDWYAAGPKADDCWKEYEEERGRTYAEAIDGYAAVHIHDFDQFHLDRVDMALLALPAGKSSHLELGYVIGKGKPGFILLDETKCRWDVMYRFATKVFHNTEEMLLFFKSREGLSHDI